MLCCAKALISFFLAWRSPDVSRWFPCSRRWSGKAGMAVEGREKFGRSTHIVFFLECGRKRRPCRQMLQFYSHLSRHSSSLALVRDLLLLGYLLFPLLSIKSRLSGALLSNYVVTLAMTDFPDMMPMQRARYYP